MSVDTAETTWKSDDRAGRAGLRNALPAEWTKFWTVRSTPWSLFALFLLTLGIGMLSTNALVSRDSPPSESMRHILIGFNFGQFAVGVLGIMFLSAEFGTGLIRSTLAAMPRRSVVLIAKAIIIAVVTFVVGEFFAFSTFFVAQAMLSNGPHAVSLSQPGVMRVLIESGIYLTLMALIGLGLAAVMKNTAASIAIFAGVVLIVAIIIGAMPTAIQNALTRFLPLTIGSTVFSTVTPPRLNNIPTFSSSVGLVVLAVYAAVLMFFGWWLMERRDT